MTCLQTKITTYPALPIVDISPLEKLILSKVSIVRKSMEAWNSTPTPGP
jgi:hypothetical protein